VSSGAPERLAAARVHLNLIGGAILSPAGCRRPVEGEAFVAAPIVGSLIVVAAITLFTVIVFRTSRNRPFRGATIASVPAVTF
jgi:hypothetical protein